MRVLIVDDSVVFRSQIKVALEGVPGITVAGVAANGKIALEKMEQSKVDVVVLDLEMPELDGMQTLAEMKRRQWRQRVIVFAAATKSGSIAALEALQAGASDFVAKPTSVTSLDEALASIRDDLVPKVLQFVELIASDAAETAAGHVASATKQAAPPPPSAWSRLNLFRFKPRVVVIGSSTGGPNALERCLVALRGRALQVPIVIAQHMPAFFTESLAKRLGELCGHPAAEGRQGETVIPGRIYVAPGDFHMYLRRSPDGRHVMIALDQGPKRNSVRPAVDHLFESAAKVYGGGVAAFVLTGMGEDGMLGAKAVKEATGGVMIQDRESSIVWGMPGAVHAAGAFDLVGSIDECGQLLAQMVT